MMTSTRLSYRLPDESPTRRDRPINTVILWDGTITAVQHAAL